MSELIPHDYGEFLAELKPRIRRAQFQALRAANVELVNLYWELGESIHRKQEQVGWGKAVVKNLARDLQDEFPGRNGFSTQNLWFMRQFYAEYRDRPKLQPLVREISWSKNLVIMSRCKDDLHRQPSDWRGHLHGCGRTSRSLPRRTPQPRSHRRTAAPVGWQGGGR